MLKKLKNVKLYIQQFSIFVQNIVKHILCSFRNQHITRPTKKKIYEISTFPYKNPKPSKNV